MTAIYIKPLSISPLTLAGDISAPIVNPDPVTNASNNMITEQQDWAITIDWNLHGNFLDIFPFAGCRWAVKAYLEGWGSDTNELEIEGETQPLLVDGAKRTVVPSTATDPTMWKYSEKINVEKGNLNPGPYKLAITITLFQVDLTDPKNPVDIRPLPIAGFIEYPDMLQVFEE